MKNVNFKNKELVNFIGIVLCDNQNLPKVYSGAKNATIGANNVNGKIHKITPLKEKYYVIK